MTLPLDADLGDHLAAGHFGPAPRCLGDFERAFMDLVHASHPDPSAAWDSFYDATLTRVVADWGQVPGTGTVATFTRIWTRAASLLRGTSVLDVGTCFGFFPLAWSVREGAPDLLAVDLSHASTALLDRQARRLGLPVDVLCADGMLLPLRDEGVDTVNLLHVLEHLRPVEASYVLREALRVARRRVVVAVPFEDAPDPLFGHVQVFDLRTLAALGERTGWHVSLAESDGGWLVLDRP
jgi:hypothetical protein